MFFTLRPHFQAFNICLRSQGWESSQLYHHKMHRKVLYIIITFCTKVTENMKGTNKIIKT